MKIVAAAIKWNGLIISKPQPCRHCHILVGMFYNIPTYKETDHDQGFLTDQGTFVDRYEGAKIAKESGQVKDTQLDYLLSEDLW